MFFPLNIHDPNTLVLKIATVATVSLKSEDVYLNLKEKVSKKFITSEARFGMSSLKIQLD